MLVRRACAVVGVAALLLTGCAGEDPAPSTLDPVTAAPSPTAAATPAGLTTADLEKTAREYYSALVRSLRTNDLAPYAEVTATACACFASVKATIDDWKKRGVRSNVATRVVKVVDPRIDAPDTGRIGVIFEEPPSTLVDGSGRVVENSAGTTPRQEELRVQRVQGRLMVVDNIDLGLVGG